MKLKKPRPFQWRTGKHRRLSENGYLSQSLRHAEIIILEILYAFLWLKFPPSPAQSAGSST